MDAILIVRTIVVFAKHWRIAWVSSCRIGFGGVVYQQLRNQTMPITRAAGTSPRCDILGAQACIYVTHSSSALLRVRIEDFLAQLEIWQREGA